VCAVLDDLVIALYVTVDEPVGPRRGRPASPEEVDRGSACARKCRPRSPIHPRTEARAVPPRCLMTWRTYRRRSDPGPRLSLNRTKITTRSSGVAVGCAGASNARRDAPPLPSTADCCWPDYEHPTAIDAQGAETRQLGSPRMVVTTLATQALIPGPTRRHQMKLVPRLSSQDGSGQVQLEGFGPTRIRKVVGSNPTSGSKTAGQRYVWSSRRWPCLPR
jgi:hypothetical protein